MRCHKTRANQVEWPSGSAQTGTCLALSGRALKTLATHRMAREHAQPSLTCSRSAYGKNQLLRYLEAVELRGVLAHEFTLVGLRHVAEFAGQDFL